MSRVPRTELVGDLFHVIARGVARHPIFVDDVDRRRYLSLLGRTTRQENWRCLSHCLMANNTPLLLEAAMTDVSKGMHRLQGECARAFKRRHRGSGHLFQD